MVAAIAGTFLPTFTEPATFVDALVNGGLTGEQISDFETVFQAEGLTDLAFALRLLKIYRTHSPEADIPDRRAFETSVYRIIRQNEARIRELLARAQVSPGTIRFDPDPRDAVERAFGAGHRESPAPKGDASIAWNMVRTYHPLPPSAVVAYGTNGTRLAVATSPEALETKLARMVALETGNPEYRTILIGSIHGREFVFGEFLDRYEGKITRIQEELNNLSDKRFVGFWFDLRWEKAVKRIQDSRNILALNVLEVAFVQYNAGKISYGTLVKVIKALDVVTKQDPAADIRKVSITDSFVYDDNSPFNLSLGNRVEWTAASLPRGVHVLVLEQVPLTTP